MATADEFAAAAWTKTLTASNGVTAPAGVFLTDTYLNAVAAKNNADFASQWAKSASDQVTALAAKVDALALVAGDPDALKAAVTDIVRGLLNDTVLEVRPPS